MHIWEMADVWMHAILSFQHKNGADWCQLETAVQSLKQRLAIVLV